MTLNNRTFTLLKIVLLIIISIFIAEIIVLPKIEHDMLQEAGRQELVTVQQICGAVLENYPDVEQDFILGLRQPTNSLQEKGEQILKQYGYDEEHLLADNTLYAAYMIAWRNWTGFFLVTTFLLLAAALLYFYSTIRSSNKEILLILEQYLSEDFSFAYGTERIVKGRIHFMSNQIGDRLKQLGHQIVTKNTRITEEKESTKALVTDISHQLKTPMAALKTCFYMYLDASDADEKTEFLKRSETQLEKLEQLIASLMNISRLETAMISLTKESILLSDLLVDKAMLKKTDIEPMVIEAIREIVRNEEYAQAIKKRIGVQIDTKAVDKELEGYQAKLKEVDLNKTRLEREIDSLPADAKYRERKLHDMTLRLDSLYDVIVELEEKIEDARLRRDAIKQQAITLENIYKIMVNFDCVYNIINDEEKRNVVTALIKEIEIYRNDESEYPLKRIGLNFPVFKDGGEVTELLWDKGNTVECVLQMTRKSN